jgi:hypothetical protein
VAVRDPLRGSLGGHLASTAETRRHTVASGEAAALREVHHGWASSPSEANGHRCPGGSAASQRGNAGGKHVL